MSKEHNPATGPVTGVPVLPAASKPQDAGLSIDKAKLPKGFFTNQIIELIAMHKFCRPAHSATEQHFCSHYLGNMPGVTSDPEGNWIGCIPKPDGTKADVLWSSHTDTVHHKEGLQKLAIVGTHLRLHKKEKASCLGADCTVGVWLMRQMFLAGIPGLYIWHAAEETGGHGSAYIASKRPELLEGITKAIAFDRRGKNSIITHQGSKRCASDTFGKALATALGADYELDSGGTFTDTANYAKLVPECTNVSVGYEMAHSTSERTCLLHAKALLEALLHLNVDDLPVERDPTKVEYRTFGSSYGGMYGDGYYYGGYGGGRRGWESYLDDDLFHGGGRRRGTWNDPPEKDKGNQYTRIDQPGATSKPAVIVGGAVGRQRQALARGAEEVIVTSMRELILKHPLKIAKLLYDEGWLLSDLMKHVVKHSK